MGRGHRFTYISFSDRQLFVSAANRAETEGVPCSVAISHLQSCVISFIVTCGARGVAMATYGCWMEDGGDVGILDLPIVLNNLD